MAYHSVVVVVVVVFFKSSVPNISDKPQQTQWTRKFGSVLQGDYTFNAAETIKQNKIDTQAQGIQKIVYPTEF